MSECVLTFECHCRQQIDAQYKERIVTEACGHSKCRNCFIKEESGCVKCLSLKTAIDQHTDPTVKNAIQNNEMIKSIPLPIISKLNHLSKETSSSKPKDIRVLEEVIIKPFIEIPSNGSDGFTFPRIIGLPKTEYPSHITRKTVNGKTEFECTICKKSFRSKSNRRYHFYCDETVVKPYNCSKCSKRFATKNHLEYHENRHNNIKHVCNECNRTFLSRVSLQKHSKTHTTDHKFICDHCNMKFHNKSDLVLHMYSHQNGPLPFQCDACDKSFSAKFKLNQHIETHKGVKSHRCQFCEKRFTRNSTLTIHLLTHSTLDTKYECKLCSKSFERQRSYERHKKIKHGSTVFQCPLCDVQSGRKDNILRHIRNLHCDEKFDDIIKRIYKTVARLKVAEFVENPEVPIETVTTLKATDSVATTNVETAENLNVNQTSVDEVKTVCQYQSVIQFAGRLHTSPPPPMEVTIEECTIETNSPAIVNVSTVDDNKTDKNEPNSFSNQLRVELVEPDENTQKISNISIYRQLLSPYLRPPPNLDFRNGSQEQEHRRYHVQSDHLPIRKENVDIYRSILMSTTDHEQQSVIHNNSNDMQDNIKLPNSKTESLAIRGQSSEYFSEMHWRKRTSQSFKQMEQ